MFLIPPKLIGMQEILPIDGLSQDNVDVRKKGSDAPSIKISTNKYVRGQYLGRTANITLNNNAEDPTRLKTCLNTKVFDMAGYPAPRCNLVNVTINSQPMGLIPIWNRLTKISYSDYLVAIVVIYTKVSWLILGRTAC